MNTDDCVVGAQASLGRTDLVRGHRVLAWVLWVVVFAGLLTMDLGSRWFVNAGAQDLANVKSVGAMNQGTWVALFGRAKHRGNYYPVFLFDTATGRSLRTGAAGNGWLEEMPLISERGNCAVWLAGTKGKEQQTLFRADLDQSPIRSVCTAIPVVGKTLLALSADGTRVALLQPNLVSIYRLPGGEFVGGTSLRSPGQLPSEVQFLTPDRVRIFVVGGYLFQSGRVLEILEFDALTRTIETLGRIEGLGSVCLSSSPSIPSMITWTGKSEAGRISLREARTGREIKTLSLPGEIGSPYFLPDGRVVMPVMPEHENARLLVLAPTGNEERVIVLPGKRASIGEECMAGRLMVTLYQSANRSSKDWSLMIVDLGSGQIRSISEMLAPVNAWNWHRNILTRAPVISGYRQSHLYLSPASALIEYDPLKDTARTLIASAK